MFHGVIFRVGNLWCCATAYDFWDFLPDTHYTLRPRQDGHFPDDSDKNIFLNKNVWILIKVLLKFVP